MDPIKRKKLYDSLKESGEVTVSFEDFTSGYSTPEKQQKLYDVLKGDGRVTVDFNTFSSGYFGDLSPKKPTAEAGTESLSVSANGNSSSDSKENVTNITPKPTEADYLGNSVSQKKANVNIPSYDVSEKKLETPYQSEKVAPKLSLEKDKDGFTAGTDAVLNTSAENYQPYTNNRFTHDVGDSFNAETKTSLLKASDVSKNDVEDVNRKMSSPNGSESFDIAFKDGSSVFGEKDAFAYELSAYGGSTEIDKTTLDYNRNWLTQKAKEDLASSFTSAERKSDWFSRNSKINLFTGQSELNQSIPSNDPEPMDVNGRDNVLGVGARVLQDFHGDKLKGVDLNNLSYYLRVSGKEKEFQEKGAIGQGDAVNTEENAVDLLKGYTQWKNDAELKDAAILKSRADMLSYKIESGEYPDESSYNQDVELYNLTVENINSHLTNIQGNETTLAENIIPEFQEYVKVQEEKAQDKSDYWEMKRKFDSGEWESSDVVDAVGFTASNVYNNVKDVVYNYIAGGSQLLYDNLKHVSIPYQLMNEEQKAQSDRVVDEFTDFIINGQEEMFDVITKDIQMFVPTEYYEYKGQNITLKDGLFFDENGKQISVASPEQLIKTGEDEEFDSLAILPDAATQISLMGLTVMSGNYSPYLAYNFKETKQEYLDAFPDATEFEASQYALLTNGVETLTERISPDKKLLGINAGNRLIDLLKGTTRETRWQATKSAGKEFLYNFFAEQGEELAVIPLQKGINFLSNLYNGDKKLQQEIESGGLTETIIATATTFPFMGAGGSIAKYRDGRSSLTENDLLLSAVRNEGAYSKINEWVREAETNPDVSKESLSQFKEKLNDIIQYKDRIPTNYSFNEFEKAKGFIQEKEALIEKKKELDPAFHEEINQQIEVVDEKIKSIKPKVSVDEDVSNSNPLVSFNYEADYSNVDLDLDSIDYIVTLGKNNKFSVVSKDGNGNDLASISVINKNGVLTTDGIYLADKNTLKGNGIGLASAKEMVKEANKKNVEIFSSNVSLTEDGINLWDRLVRDGFAEKLPDIISEDGEVIPAYKTIKINKAEVDQKIKKPESKTAGIQLSDKTKSVIDKAKENDVTIADVIEKESDKLEFYKSTYGETDKRAMVQESIVNELKTYNEGAIDSSIDNLKLKLVNGKPEVTNKKGNKVSEKQKRKAVRESVQTGLYDGIPRALDNAPKLSSDEEVSSYIADNSDNPLEIAEEIKNIQSRANSNEVGFEDVLLPHIRGGVKEESFVGNSDKNNVTPKIRGSYFNKNGKSLDVIAQDVEVEMYGDYNANAPRITEQDIVDFILENPSVVDYENAKKSNEQIALETKFTEITGLPATKQNIDAFVPKSETNLNKGVSDFDSWSKSETAIRTDSDGNLQITSHQTPNGTIIHEREQDRTRMGLLQNPEPPEYTVELSMESNESNRHKIIKHNGRPEEDFYGTGLIHGNFNEIEDAFNFAENERDGILSEFQNDKITKAPEEDFPFSVSADTKPFESDSKEGVSVAKLKAKYPDAFVVQSESDLPEPIQDGIRQHKAEGKIKGVFFRGRVFMVADNIKTMGQARGTYRHERLGHQGVIEHLGDKLTEFSNSIIDDANGGRKKKLIELAERYGMPTDLSVLTPAQKKELGEEYIAQISENSDRYPQAWNEIVMFVRKTLKDFGIKMQVSDAEIRALIGKVEVNAKQKEKNLSQAQKDARFQIIGEKGATTLDKAEESTHRLDNIGVAREMENANKSTKEIRLATGWERGVDKKWRYEIEGNFTFKPTSNEENYVDIFDEASKRENGVLLSSALNYPELFLSYPSLRKVKLRVDDKIDSDGFFAPIENTIVVKDPYSYKGGYDKLKSVLIHEIQHAIQEIEGFAKGGNLKMLNNLDKETQNQIKKVEKAILQATKLKESGDWIYESSTLSEIIKSDTSLDQEIRNWATSITDKGQKEIDVFISETPFGKYKRIAGEVEARNVQTRASLSMEERRSTLLSETEDVAREDQIILMESLSDARFQVDAYHGSPHSFDRFTTDKMGTGEGTQAFGWGLYFTDLKSIAEGYARNLRPDASRENQVINQIAKDELDTYNGNREQAIESLEETLNESWSDKKRLRKAIQVLKSGKELNVKLSNVYTVSLHKGKTPDQYTWLEWDRPVTASTISKLNKYAEDNFDGDLLERFSEVLEYSDVSNNGQLYKDLTKLLESDKDVSMMLLELGIDGIKYPAESISRGATSDNARGFNYVVFDENAVTIEESIRFQKTKSKPPKKSVSEILNDRFFKARDLTLGIKEKENLNKQTKRKTEAIWKKANRGFNVMFRSGGGLSKEFSEIVKQLGRDQSAVLDRLSYESQQLKRVIAKATKGKTDVQFNEIGRWINAYMAGEDVDLSFMGQDALDQLDYFRARIDSVSNKILDVLNKKMAYWDGQLSAISKDDDLSKAMEEILSNTRKAPETKQSEIITALVEAGYSNSSAISHASKIIAREKTAGLIKTIEDNKGKYINRSYEAFHNPRYLEDLSTTYKKMRPHIQKRFDRAVDYLVNNEGYTKENAIIEVNKYIADLVKSEDVGDFIMSSTGRANAPFLKQRKELPLAFRELLGEVKDPTHNYIRTVFGMSEYLAKLDYQERMRDALLKANIGSYQAKDANYELFAGTSPEWSILHGLYVPKEFKQAMDDMADLDPVKGKASRFYIKLTGWTKVGKTVWSPTTMFRNLYSGVALGINSGHFFGTHPKHTLEAYNQAFGTNKSVSAEQAKLFREKLVSLGVIGDGVNSGELRATLNDFKKPLEEMVKPSRLGRAINFMNTAYAFGDDFYKVVGFLTERDRFIKSGMDKKLAEIKAAERIRGGYPTYSYLPKGMKALRRFPLMATFVSFPYEAVRTTKNNMIYAYEDFLDGRTSMGMKRVAGLLAANVLNGGAVTLINSLLDWDDEDEKVVRKMLPEYQKNANLLFVRGKDGDPMFVDMTSLFPSEVWMKPLATLMGGRSDHEIFISQLEDASNELVAPYLGFDITTKTMLEVLLNKEINASTVFDLADFNNIFGRDIRGADKNSWENGWAVANHYLKKSGPGVYNNISEGLRSNSKLSAIVGEKETPEGRVYENGDAVMAFFGFRATTLNHRATLKYYGFKTSGELVNIGSNARKEADKTTLRSDKSVDATVNEMVSEYKRLSKEAREVIDVSRKLGLKDSEIFLILTGSSTVSKADAKVLIMGGDLFIKPIGDKTIERELLDREIINSDKQRGKVNQETYLKNASKINKKIVEENKRIAERNNKLVKGYKP